LHQHRIVDKRARMTLTWLDDIPVIARDMPIFRAVYFTR